MFSRRKRNSLPAIKLRVECTSPLPDMDLLEYRVDTFAECTSTAGRSTDYYCGYYVPCRLRAAVLQSTKNWIDS